MTKNPIIEELHKVREQLLTESGGTLDGLVDRLQAEEKQSNRPRFQARRTIRCTGAAKSPDVEMDNQSSPPRDR